MRMDLSTGLLKDYSSRGRNLVMTFSLLPNQKSLLKKNAFQRKSVEEKKMLLGNASQDILVR